jgi:hypothetical protein
MTKYGRRPFSVLLHGNTRTTKGKDRMGSWLGPSSNDNAYNYYLIIHHH